MEYLKCLVYTLARRNKFPGEAVLLMETLHSTPVDSNQIRRWTDMIQYSLKSDDWYNLDGRKLTMKT